jgi:hypothetical protein
MYLYNQRILFIASVLLLVVFLFSCGGGLTDEQRKKIKEEMETSQIKKVSEAQITEEVLASGRQLVAQLGKSKNADSLAMVEKVIIHWLEPSANGATQMESQLIEAYLTDLTGGTLDNVQKIGTDSLLYTMPVVEKQADSSDVVKGIWSIYFSRKQVVLGM